MKLNINASAMIRSLGLAVLAGSFGSGLCNAQGTPFAGTINLSLTLSTLAPPASSTFTADVIINTTGVTGTCPGPVVAPFNLGGYTIGVNFVNTKLAFVSVAACPTAPAEFSTGVSCSNLGSEVRCSNVNSANNALPAPGALCVHRLTFQNLTATTISPTTLVTIHTPAPRSISSQLITAPACGPATFPAGSVNDFTTPSITPVELLKFEAI